MVLEINGISIQHSDTAKMFVRGAEKLNMLIIPGAKQKAMKNRWSKKTSPMTPKDRNKRTKDFFKRVDEVLHNDPARKDALLALLKQYAKDKRIEHLARTLMMLLNTPAQRQLLQEIRIFIPPMHREKFDKTIARMNQQPARPVDARHLAPQQGRKKVVRIVRTGGVFGFTLTGQNPVIVESVDPGGPALKGGLMPGDKILELNGLDVAKKTHSQLIELLKGSGNTPTLVVQSQAPPPPRVREVPDIQPVQSTVLNQSVKEDLTISGVSRQQLVHEGRNLREMLQHHLTPRERSHVKTSLQTYADTRNLDGLIIDLFPILDTPAKKGVWYYIIQVLPSDQQVACWRKVLYLMDKHAADRAYGGARRKGLHYSPWQGINHPEETYSKSPFSARSGRYDVTPTRGDVIYKQDSEFVPVAIAAALLDLEKKDQSLTRRSLPFYKESPMLLRNRKLEIHDVTEDSDITPSHPVPYEYDTRRRDAATLTEDEPPIQYYQQQEMQASGFEDLTQTDSLQRMQRATAIVHAQQHIHPTNNSSADVQSDSDNISQHSSPRSSKSVTHGSPNHSYHSTPMSSKMSRSSRDQFPIAIESDISDISVADPQVIYREKRRETPSRYYGDISTHHRKDKVKKVVTSTESSGIDVTNIDSDSDSTETSDSSQPNECVYTINETLQSNNSEDSNNITPTNVSINTVNESHSSDRSVDDRLEDLLRPEVSMVGNRMVIINEMQHDSNISEHGNSNNNATSLSTVPEAPPLMVPPLPGEDMQGVNMRVKRINWEKLSNTQNTIWGQLDSRDGGEDDLNEVVRQLDLEEQFSTKAKKTSISPREQKKEQILESKKAYNISILLAHSRMSAEEIRTALLTMDEGKLQQAHLQQLHSFSPSKEEIAKLKEVKPAEKSYLSKADQFALELITVPQFKVRLQGLIFKSNFSDKYIEIKSALECVLRASNELRASRKLAKVLELVLVMGNYMNQGNRRVGNASGFKISLLPELDTTKTSDNKSTFLHVLAKAVNDKVPAVLSFAEEIPNVPPAAKISDRTLVIEIEDLKNTFTEINQTVNLSKSDEQTTAEDKFYEVMETVTKDARDKLNDLSTSQSQVMDAYKNTVEFFGEDIKLISSDNFFKIFADFTTKFEKANKDNIGQTISVL
ncbi:delphilin-like [Glandiceps talaboti]